MSRSYSSIYTKICSVCNSTFTTSWRIQKFCTAVCRDKHKTKARNKEKQKSWRLKNYDRAIQNNRRWKEDNKEYVLEQSRKYTREYTKSNKTEIRDRHLKRKYGITSEQYEELLSSQDHCCAICLKHKSLFRRRLDVEHNHQTGEIQGIVCSHCNRMRIGRNRDPEIFERIANYLRNSHTGFFVPKKIKKKRTRKKK